MPALILLTGESQGFTLMEKGDMNRVFLRPRTSSESLLRACLQISSDDTHRLPHEVETMAPSAVTVVTSPLHMPSDAPAGCSPVFTYNRAMRRTRKSTIDELGFSFRSMGIFTDILSTI